MIKIVARRIVKEECIEAFQKAVGELVSKSLAEEGNIQYSLNQSVKDPRVHCFIEVWKDQEAIDIHNATEHFTRIVPALAEFTQESLSVDFFREVEY